MRSLRTAPMFSMREALLLLAVLPSVAVAGGGPLGIDHRWNYDNTGIWKRSYQNVLQYGGPVLDFAFAAWEGGETRLESIHFESAAQRLRDWLQEAILAAIGHKRKLVPY